MSTRPVFQRSTRTHFNRPPGEKVDIPPPPQMPQHPGFPWQGIAGGVSISALYYMSSMGHSGGGGNPFFIAISPVVGALFSVIQFLVEKKKYSTKCAEREENYEALLKDRLAVLNRLREEQKSNALLCDPSPEECCRIVPALDRRLWDRSPGDPDFLSPRIGHGLLPFTAHMESSLNDNAAEVDPLVTMAQTVIKDFSTIDEMPINLPLMESGVVGISGEWESVLEAARLLVIQTASHHSPDEVKLITVYRQEEAVYWEWMRWLPHTWTDDYSHRFLARTEQGTRELLKKMQETLNRRKLLARAVDNQSSPAIPFYIFIFSDPRVTSKESLAGQLITHGKSMGAVTIFLAPREELLPKGCNALVSVEGESAHLKVLIDGIRSISCTRDHISLEAADNFARSIAPVSLQRLVGHDALPPLVTLFEILNCRQPQELDILSLWQSSEPFSSLAVPVGRIQGGDLFLLDIHEKSHGIHGLIAGTTGSGKSEFLQTLVTSLALHFHPHELSFLFVDFKGGGTAKIFSEIPHLAGSMTNLEGHLVERARVSIDGEKRRREKLLAASGTGTINEYLKKRRQGKEMEPLPLLLIVVDEFAELATEEPEFMKELIKVARVGRSLGMFLVLATQKPAGVVNEQIWSNCNYRVCFRVQSTQDSLEVIKCPDAAALTGSGKAYIQVGNNEIFTLFQAAWGGVPYSAGDYHAIDPHEIVEVNLNGARRSLTDSGAMHRGETHSQDTQAQVLLSYIATTARQTGIERLQGPWLPPLPTSTTLDEIKTEGGWDGAAWAPSPSWMNPVVGLLDDPASQQQGPMTIDLAKAGHILVYGAPGTGKTTFVETLIISLAMAHKPEDLSLYLLDFGGRYLTLFKELPHAGAVILPDDRERLERLYRFIQKEMELRKELFASCGVKTLEAYRSTGDERLPAIVVIVDNFAGFINSYPDDDEYLAAIAREGGNLGIHLVITAHSPNLIRFKVTNNITLSVAFELAEKSDYSAALNASGVFSLPRIPGRGLVNYKPPLEFQTALAAPGGTESERNTALRSLVEKMAALWKGKRAKQIPSLPREVSLDSLLQPRLEWEGSGDPVSVKATVGIDAEDLEPFSISLPDGPHFLVTGPAQSGKSTLLQTMIISLALRFPPEKVKFCLVDFRSRALVPFKNLPHTTAYCTSDETIDAALMNLTEEIQRRKDEIARTEEKGEGEESNARSQLASIVFVMDEFEAFMSESFSAKEKLMTLLRMQAPGFHFIVSSASSELSSNWDELASLIKKFRTGFLLGSCDQSDLDLLGIKLPFGRVIGDLSAGNGFFAKRQKYIRVKCASPSIGKVAIPEWIGAAQGRKS